MKIQILSSLQDVAKIYSLNPLFNKNWKFNKKYFYNYRCYFTLIVTDKCLVMVIDFLKHPGQKII